MAQTTSHAWFDVKVFYIRVSSCLLDEAPDLLFMVYPKRDINTELEINGGRISPAESVCFALRLDRIDKDSAEATYVNTNNVRTTGGLPFQIYDNDDLLLQGTLSHAADMKEDHQITDGYSSIGTSPLSIDAGWSMDCSYAIASTSCPFLKRRVDFSTGLNPAMDVYVAGRSYGLPIVLTQTVQLAAKKKSPRCCSSSLDAIPEEEESQCKGNSSGQGDDDEAYTKPGSEPLALGIPNHLYFSDIGAYGDDVEEGELSWFNAGVRVGVGLGLGMCLGVGIGVGLLMRTYQQAATGSFRRHLF